MSVDAQVESPRCSFGHLQVAPSDPGHAAKRISHRISPPLQGITSCVPSLSASAALAAGSLLSSEEYGALDLLSLLKWLPVLAVIIVVFNQLYANERRARIDIIREGVRAGMRDYQR